jgi:hypothetical protein
LPDFCPSHRQMPALDRATNGWSAQDLADPGDGMQRGDG